VTHPGSLAAAVENTSAAQLAIAQSQAQASANSAYLTMAAVAEGALPKIRNVVQIIVIAIFPIVLILVLMAGHKGGIVLKSYVMAMVWIELWPVLYAVTSYVAHLAAAPGVSSGLIGGLAGVPAGPGLSLLNSINIEDTLLRDEAVAGMFSLLIPVMAYAILKGGEVAMSGLASQLMAPATSAAQKAGGEAGLGNLAMGNVRYDTFAARTSMANSWSTRPSIDSGAGGGYRHTDPSLREPPRPRVPSDRTGTPWQRHAGRPGHAHQPGWCVVRQRRHRCGKHQPQRTRRHGRTGVRRQRHEG
jgi:conjugal transfer mating pair stabilization protein TraG